MSLAIISYKKFVHPLSQVKSPKPQTLFHSSQTRFYYSEMQVYSYQGPSENLLQPLTIKPPMLCNLQAQGSSDSLNSLHNISHDK